MGDIETISKVGGERWGNGAESGRNRLNSFDRAQGLPYDRAPMLNDPLPRQVDVRKLVAAGASISAREPLASFGRLCAMLESDGGSVEVLLRFFVDEQGLRRIDGEVRTQVQVMCQRCMQAMPLDIDSRFEVAVVWSDDEAQHLPRQLDAYAVGEEPQDVRDLVEDELIISVPYASYHEPGRCRPPGFEGVEDVAEPEPVEEKENPFKVLERLKSGEQLK